MADEEDHTGKAEAADNQAALPIVPKNKSPRSKPRKSKGHEKKENPRDQLLVRWTRAVALFTLVLALTSAASDFIFWRQLAVMRSDPEESIGEQRAWLTFDPKFHDMGVAFSVFGDGSATAFLDISATNVGKLPALETTVWGALYPAPAHATADTPMPPFPVIVCPKADPPQEDDPLRGRRGMAIFPSQTVPLFLGTVNASRQTIEAMRDYKHEVGFMVAVCVQYRSGNAGPMHKTGAIYHIARKGGSYGFTMDPFDSREDYATAEGLELIRLAAGDETN